MHLWQTTTKGSEVLAEYENRASINLAVANNDTVACHFVLVHTKINALMFDKSVVFTERAIIQQQGQTFASC